MQIKPTMRYHSTPTIIAIIIKEKPTITNIGKDVERLESSYFAGGDIG